MMMKSNDNKRQSSKTKGDKKGLRVIITDIQIPFWSLVSFLVRLTLAMIPAIITVLLIINWVGKAIIKLGGG